MNNEELSKLNTAMRALYDKNKNLFDKKTAGWVEEYIRVGELGLALESFIFCLERDKLQFPESEKIQMYALAQQMKLDLNEVRANWPKL